MRKRVVGPAQTLIEGLLQNVIFVVTRIQIVTEDSGHNRVDEIVMPKMSSFAAAAPVEDADILAEFLPISAQIEHFLAGDTSGRALFQALYDHILDEPVPQRLKAVLPR